MPKKVASKQELPAIKFVHVREYDNQGEPLPHGGITVAFMRVSTTLGVDTYHVSKALCSVRDNFCKKIGRSIAAGRLLVGTFDKVTTKKTRMKEVAEDMRNWALTDAS